MTWLWILVAWLLTAVVLALVIGRVVHTADAREHTDEASESPPKRPDVAAPPAGGQGPPAPTRPRGELAEH